jgi:uncharacterized membrane protein YgcG
MSVFRCLRSAAVVLLAVAAVAMPARAQSYSAVDCANPYYYQYCQQYYAWYQQYYNSYYSQIDPYSYADSYPYYAYGVPVAVGLGLGFRHHHHGFHHGHGGSRGGSFHTGGGHGRRR